MRLLLGALAWLLLCQPAARADDAITSEMNRRNQELVQRGFNLTSRISLHPEPSRIELWVPASGEEHEISLWFAAREGEIAARLVGADGAVVASCSGKRCERSVRIALAAGKYTVEASGTAGAGVVGVKGQVVTACPIDRARVSLHESQPAKGFHWPYLLVAARSGSANTLLVLPNNSGVVTEDVGLLRAAATCELTQALAMADRLGTPLLMPLFPRPAIAGVEENLYLHALTRAALTTRTPRLARVDLQLVAMIDDARARLGTAMKPRVLMAGFSASGSFTNRFALLHPERVLAAAVGSPGGWPIAPSREPDLTYPIGIADLPALTGMTPDDAALRQVRFFFFMGAADQNDSVIYRDSFSAADEKLVMRRFGKNPVARWDAARRLYERAGLRAQFKLYPGVAHEQTPQMEADLEAAFAAALR